MFYLQTYKIEYKMVLIATKLCVTVGGKGDCVEASSCRNTEQGNSALIFAFNAHT